MCIYEMDPTILCPLQCVSQDCPMPGFMEKNSAWLLTVIAGCTGCVGMVLTYFLKSRCKQIGCCGVHCIRDVVDLRPASIEITSSKTGV